MSNLPIRSNLTGLSELPPCEVINAVGYATRVCGSCPSAEVQAVMQWAQERFFEMDDLLAYASRTIARVTGSEAGLVTCGASAGLTLGAAAILAGDNPDAMDALPDVSCLPRNRFLYPEPHRFDYDHPVRAAGASLTPFSFDNERLEERLEAAFSSDLAGVVFVWKHRLDTSLIRRIAMVCRKAGIPFILDGAMALPPSENLREIANLGANLVVISGGKHLGGPQNSGLLFGDAALIRSAWLQMVDMDVRPGSWSLRQWIEEGTISRPPRHGIGRGFKVGKDAILGCLCALENYDKRDFAAEAVEWAARCTAIATALSGLSSFEVTCLPENGTGQYPVVRIRGERMNALKAALKQEHPRIILAEDEHEAEVAWIYPMCLNDVETAVLINRMAAAMKS